MNMLFARFACLPLMLRWFRYCAKTLCWGLMASLLLLGCATNQPNVFKLTPPDIQGENKEMTWPTKDQVEVPRFLYLGELRGEENFQKAEGIGTIRKVISWLADFIFGEAVPVILQRPQSGLVDESGRIFVTDTSRQAVYVFDQKLGRMDVWEQAVGNIHFSSPTGIALGMEGDVFVADSNLGFVVRLNAKGENVGVIGDGVLKRPVGVAFDALLGLLYVADTYDHDIKVFDAEGNLLHMLGHGGDGVGDFNFPTYITLNQNELYVVDSMDAQIHVLDTVTGDPKRQFGERGLNIGNLVRPKGVALDSERNVYIVESYYDHLLVYNQKAELLLPIGGTGQNPGQFYLPAGVWIDKSDKVYVADMFNGRVSVFQFLSGVQSSE